MPKMTQSEINEFLQDPLHAIVATNPADGPPQLSRVWFIYEDETLYINILHNSAKRRNLERDPRISVCIDGGRADVRYVTFYGSAQLFGPDTALQDEWRWRIIWQYNSTEEATRRYYEAIKDMAATLIVLKPDRVIRDDFN